LATGARQNATMQGAFGSWVAYRKWTPNGHSLQCSESVPAKS
jgi:hypothetical protein